jgi:hypothetical protein
VRDKAICEQICISVEGYSTQLLRQERQALKAAESASERAKRLAAARLQARQIEKKIQTQNSNQYKSK